MNDGQNKANLKWMSDCAKAERELIKRHNANDGAMPEDILERAKKALIDDDMTYEDYDECISLLIAEVEANQIMLRQFQVHEDQTHAAMEGLLGNSDNFIELAREMKEEVGRLRSENLELRVAVLGPDGIRANQEVIIGEQAARIKELESEITAWIADRDSWIARYEAVREAPREMAELMAREALERIRNGDLCPKHFTERMRERIKEGGKDESQ